MKSDFIARRALLILCVLFFLVPFAMRGARMSWERTENRVKDWLPATLEETQDLAWFDRYFVNEQASVVLTWDGCSEKDESFRLFVQKLRNEIKPADEGVADEESTSLGGSESGGEATADRVAQRVRESALARQLGDELGLYDTGDYHANWGGLHEKWLRGTGQSWYYITPQGELYRWNGSSHVLGALSRWFRRTVLGDTALDGTLVARLGQPPTGVATNAFHDDPQRLVARVLRSVTTGPEVLAELSAPGGATWPAGEASEAERAQQARRAALDRLNGTFFGPEPYGEFAWTADDLPRVLREATVRQLPRDWHRRVDQFIGDLLGREYEGQRSELVAESLSKKEEHWNAMFAALAVEPPGLQTCILVTLSDPGRKDLGRVLGRGLFGQPRGKLLNLAVESGVSAPAAPPLFSWFGHQADSGRVLRMGGPVADDVAFNEEGQITLVRLAASLAVLSIVLSYLAFQRLTAGLMILTVSVVSALASLSIVWWSGSHVDAMLWMMPPLIFVLAMTGAFHVINCYRHTSRTQGVQGAPARALAQAAAPCILAAVTIAAGLFALGTSDNHPIRQFGFFAALGVLATLIVLLTFLPAALQLWPLTWERARTQAAAGRPSRAVRWVWQLIGDQAAEHNWWVAASAIGLMIGLGLNLGSLQMSVKPRSLFRQDTQLIRDYAWLEAHVGKPVPMELVIGVDQRYQLPNAEAPDAAAPADSAAGDHRGYQYSLPERIQLVGHVQHAIDRVFGAQGQDLLGPALSAVTFTPPWVDSPEAGPEPVQVSQERLYDTLRRAGYLAVSDDGTELWRINVWLSALGDIDYGRFVTQLKQVVEPVLQAYKYRDEILRQVAQPQTDAADPNAAWQDAKIVILGAPDPASAADDITTTVELPVIDRGGRGDEQRRALENENRMLGVHREFARVLSDLLRAKGFRARKGRQIPRQFVDWQDPRTNQLKDAPPEARAKYFAAFDCVVVLRDHPDYDLEFISRHAKCVVDARSHTFDPAHDQTARQLHKPLCVTYTGTVPILYRAQQTMVQSLIDCVGWSLPAIALVMMVVLRTRRLQVLNVRGGLAVMIPVMFPVVVVLGEISRRSFLVDIGTLMTAGAAMGVTAVGAYQFLTCFWRAIRDGFDRTAAIKVAFSRGSGTILQITVVAGLGLALFALGTFVPIQRFGITMLALLTAALAANVLLLPALLAGPLGRYLCPHPLAAPTRDRRVAPVEESLPPPRPAESVLGTSVATMHNPPREGRGATMIRRDGSHS